MGGGGAQLHALFVSFDAGLDAGRFMESCESLAKMDRLVALLASVPDGAPESRVLVTVRNQHRKLAARLKSRVSELFASVVSVEGTEVRIQRQLPGAPARPPPPGHLFHTRRRGLRRSRWLNDLPAPSESVTVACPLCYCTQVCTITCITTMQ